MGRNVPAECPECGEVIFTVGNRGIEIQIHTEVACLSNQLASLRRELDEMRRERDRLRDVEKGE